MARYRVYLLNDLGKIFHGEDVEARDNAAVIAAGWQLLEKHNESHPDIAYGIEIWLERKSNFALLDPIGLTPSPTSKPNGYSVSKSIRKWRRI
jgi:hypothetical protein